jgi:hypothetical protein
MSELLERGERMQMLPAAKSVRTRRPGTVDSGASRGREAVGVGGGAVHGAALPANPRSTLELYRK